MSGIEVAGLILGAFPLVISALKKHQEAAVVFGEWWEISRSYKECLRIVSVEQSMFDRNLKVLLAPILYDHSTLDELLADPFGVQWRSESLAASLEDLLPTSYGIYIGIIQDFHSLMVALGHELGLGKQYFQRRINACT